MAKFRNKCRIESTRNPNWDYGLNGAYYITICTKNRKLYFGYIENGEMNLSEIGKIAHQYFSEIPDHFPFVKLGAFVIMPNHVHGIIIIDKKPVETQNFGSLHVPLNIPIHQPPKTKNKFGPQSQNLGSIVRGFKTGVKKFATMHKINFTWQPKFHDHIIRNKPEYNRIKKYILNNPANWDDDKFYNL